MDDLSTVCEIDFEKQKRGLEGITMGAVGCGGCCMIAPSSLLMLMALFSVLDHGSGVAFSTNVMALLFPGSIMLFVVWLMIVSYRVEKRAPKLVARWNRLVPRLAPIKQLSEMSEEEPGIHQRTRALAAIQQAEAVCDFFVQRFEDAGQINLRLLRNAESRLEDLEVLVDAVETSAVQEFKSRISEQMGREPDRDGRSKMLKTRKVDLA